MISLSREVVALVREVVAAPARGAALPAAAEGGSSGLRGILPDGGGPLPPPRSGEEGRTLEEESAWAAVAAMTPPAVADWLEHTVGLP